ncbi:aminotransferase class I/II-fold pyridoxal phosphate-dependent enzyme [bacterium]|nr:aminotransferase class I/II-fold pyridoxal phosphate-dependent enzyme [bacterium]QQR56836.1 MAG: aminotransferase class I/II-fold pyridoxal phosphate-dependent enzyme [Candidatus Melainabacteria bacterium]
MQTELEKKQLAKFASQKAAQFKESVIREMSRLAAQYGAINLAQGLPDYPAPDELKQAAHDALFADVNQYAITWGDKLLRNAISEKALAYNKITCDPETEITVTCGATEAMIATMLALVDPHEEVIVFEPFYENYNPDTILSGAIPRYVKMRAPDWSFDEAELEKAFNDKTRAIIINTPHNPTGKIFNKEELSVIARLCQKWGVLCITDEIYEHILYDDAVHVSPGALPGMEDLTVSINSLSKTYSVTGWRVGWAIANKNLTQHIRKVHDFLTVGSPAPLQRAGVTALKLPQSFYDELSVEYNQRRTSMLNTLDAAGIPYFKPQGAYYAFCDISSFGYASDIEMMNYLVKDVKVAVVPGSSFFHDPTEGKKYVRMCFSRKMETMELAHKYLLNVKKKGA